MRANVYPMAIWCQWNNCGLIVALVTLILAFCLPPIRRHLGGAARELNSFRQMLFI